jgi:hypothetical protein
MTKKNIILALAVAAIMSIGAVANADIVPVTGVTGHDGGNWGPYLGHLTDMVNGANPIAIGGATGGDLGDPGMDITADPTDPSTWKYAGSAWGQEWKGNSRLDATGTLNNKIGYAILDFGSSITDMETMYLWNVRSQENTENVDTFNVYYSSGVGIDALPSMPQSKQTRPDYDFSSGDWVKLNASILTLPQNPSNNNTPQLDVALGGNSAQYIGIEIITAGGTANRVGLAQVEVTRTPEPATMSLLALGGLAMLRRRRRA